MPQLIEPYYDEPRLKMTAAGRMLIRIAASASYGLITAATVILVLSDVRQLRSFGLLLALFLIGRFIKIGKPELSIQKIGGGRVNAARCFTPFSYRLVESAFDRSGKARGEFVINLFRALLGRKEVKEVLGRLDVPLDIFLSSAEKISAETSGGTQSRGAEELIKETSFIATEAFSYAYKNHGNAVEPVDIFAALTKTKDSRIVRIFQQFNVSPEDLENALIMGRFRRRLFGRRAAPVHKRRHRVMNRAWTARPTPVLDRFAEDLTDLARLGSIGFMVGHEREYDQLVDVLARPGNANAVLVGEPSSGKTVIVEHLAFEIVKDRVPPPLFDRRLVSLSLGALSAGASEGELQERVKKILDEIARAGNIILFIPDMHNLVKSGGVGMRAADILIPAIKGTGFSVIGSTYPREYKQYIESESEFASSFEVIRVNEIPETEALRVVLYDVPALESKYRIVVSFKAIKKAVELAHKYFRGKRLPASARELLSEAVSDIAQKKKKDLTEADVIAIAERRVNIPLHAVEEAEAKKLLDLEAIIHAKLIDQEEAVGAVARAMREYRSGLTRRGGPIASFLFVGPTGVGKTELAKLVTEIQFGDKSLMLRFDMSEYQDKQSFSRFIGSPDGSVRGALTDAVLEKPYSLVLLDEFEKAHPDILNLFLQVFDDGRLTDNFGRTVDFTNTILVATSNAHSEFIKTEIEKKTPVPEIAEQLKRKLTDFFKAELLNRFSSIIVFKPLAPEHIQEVARLALSELSALLRENQGIDLNFDESAVREIARLGYDPAFGARPLRKVISDRIRAVLAEKILRKEIARGSAVKVGVQGEEFTFSV